MLSVVLTVHGGTVPRVILAEVQCGTKGCGCHVVSVRIPQSPGIAVVNRERGRGSASFGLPITWGSGPLSVPLTEV